MFSLKMCTLIFILNSTFSFAVIISTDFPRNITNFIPCISYLTHIYLEDHNSDFLLLSEEIEMVEPVDELLKNIPGPNVILSTNDFNELFGFFILFASWEHSYQKFLNFLEPSVYNVFLLITPYDSASDCMDRLVNEFWSFRTLEVVILTQISNREIYIHTYNPYEENFCNKPMLKLLNIWDIEMEILLYDNAIFNLSRKMRNFNKCPLVCFAKNRPPDSIVLQEENENVGKWHLDGVGGRLLIELERRLNFTAIIEQPKMNISIDKYGYDISEGFPELVVSRLTGDDADLAFGIYSHVIYDSPRTDFSAVAVSECYGWAVPAHMGKEIPAWMYYTHEFDLVAWILVLLVYIFGIFILYIVSYLFYDHSSLHKLEYSTIYMISIMVGSSSSPIVSEMKRGRVIIGVLLMSSFLISYSYQSSLGSFLTVPWRRDQIRTFQEILDGNYLVEGAPQTGKILQRLAKGEPALEELSRKYYVHKEHFDTLITRMQAQKDTVTFAAQRFVQYYIINGFNGTQRDDIFLLPQCVIQAHSSPFVFKKGSFLMSPINKMIVTAVEVGLTQYWFSYATPKLDSPFSQINTIKIHQLRSAFSILIIGLCFGLIAFLFEIHAYKRDTNKLKTSENTIVIANRIRYFKLKYVLQKYNSSIVRSNNRKIK